MRSALKKLDWTNLPVLAAFAVSIMLAPVFRAQDQGSITKVYSVPDGGEFMVDGAPYEHAVSNIWPAGSKHILSVPTTTQVGRGVKALYNFVEWDFNGTSVVNNTLAVTATPGIPEYKALFSVQYALSL